MKFYKKQHKYYCGIDLHARKMYVRIIDRDGKTITHENIKTEPDTFMSLIKPYMDDHAIGVECVFCRHRRSDLSAQKQYQLCTGAFIIHESHSREQNKK